MNKMTSNSATISNTKSQINTAKISTKAIPSPSGAPLTLTYNIPFSSSIITSLIQSLFPTVLGSSTNPASLVGAAYNSLIIY